MNITEISSLFNYELEKRHINTVWVEPGDIARINDKVVNEYQLVARSSEDAPLTEAQVVEALISGVDVFGMNQTLMTIRGLQVQAYTNGLIIHTSVGFLPEE